VGYAIIIVMSLTGLVSAVSAYLLLSVTHRVAESVEIAIRTEVRLQDQRIEKRVQRSNGQPETQTGQLATELQQVMGEPYVGT